MSTREHNLPMLNARSDWIDWYNSIEDLAKRNEVWKYCDPLGIENLVFTATKPSDSASKDTIQKFQSLQSIFDSEKKKYDKVSDRIDYTVCQEFKQHYLGKHDVRSKLVALSDSIQPNAKDQRQEIRTEFEKLRKGPGNTSLDRWLGRWPALVNSAKRYTIENLSEPQICEAFVEACRDINPPFYNYMKSKDAQSESQANGSTIADDSSDADSDDAVDEVDALAVQRAQNTIDRTLRSFRRLKPTLSDNRITISFCIKQFRSMAPPSDKAARGRAAHATLQGRKHGRDPKTSDEEDGQPRRKREAIGSSSASATQPSCLRDCVCGQAHKYSDCWYLNPAKAPAKWRPQVHIQSKVIASVTGSHRQREKIERSFSRSKIALPDFWPSNNADDQSEKATSQASSATVRGTRQTRPRASFATSRYASSTRRKPENNSYFRLDNCADTHVCNDKSRFTQYKPIHDEIIRFGDTNTRIEGVGNVSVNVTTPTGHGLVQLEDVAYVPGFHWNLISTHALEKQGLFFNTRTCWMEFSDGSKAFQVKKRGAFRVVEPHIYQTPQSFQPAYKAAHASATKKTSQHPKTSIASMDVWHSRLGHIRKEALKHVPIAVKGVTLSTHSFERNADLCQTCELSQAHQQISRIPTWRGTYPFEKVHMDLIDMEEAFNADSWVVHFYFAYSAYHISFNVTSKTQDELVSVTKEFLAITNDNWGFKTRYIRSDGEKGLGNEWKELIAAKEGITFTPSPPDTPDQNGLAERSGGVIMATARKLRIQSRLPHKLWPHIVAHATRLLNRIPVQRKDWQTPFEMVHARQPDLSYVRIIGSRAYVLIKNRRDRPARAKLQERALMGWLVGMEATNIYKIWIPQSNRVITSRDVRIDEKVLYDPQQSTAPLERSQALSTLLNDIDMNESDEDALPNGSDTAEPVEASAGSRDQEDQFRAKLVLLKRRLGQEETLIATQLLSKTCAPVLEETSDYRKEGKMLLIPPTHMLRNDIQKREHDAKLMLFE
ncbi:hypothetical protein PTTW11_05430 [Pyrenophora teres f. teres]|uniref:Uncharacterized protein n=1 Tax=Pyrenophora teres f. teres TaxID=97479 RepID=A0A6S6W1Q1_9PLEO|nr:hypothetical protein PTNB29_10486 [Pyrenophora teres f. teres]CAE7034426.1 hypothetical protein PTTW11_05430 [Pyrenophora teres f. teres]